MSYRSTVATRELAIPYIKDTGCEFSPTCQTCWLPACKDELPADIVAELRATLQRVNGAAAKSQQREALWTRIRALYLELRHEDVSHGVLVLRVAHDLGVSRRSVYRAIQSIRHRET